MRIKGLFWILTGLLLTILAVITYHVFYNYSSFMFFIVEGVVLVTILYLFLLPSYHQAVGYYRQWYGTAERAGLQFPPEPCRAEGGRPHRGHFQ